ncbi:MAG: GntR family transcriptional regulator [Gammaproteobacteria bacterium]|nr:GntR family transcriptional regulator [Gammaproteobacteria bacterium]MDG1951389.1 GntR family transcriptional regulator [Gammaproteobacteria bacterium]MDG2118306.1 GntR family transcriptional regulator [Gammaproteobacteria bacterium]|tara:strand:+ start:368 stop:1027 length:660 start_codon:yes stop_codon:yes gene_type:complete
MLSNTTPNNAESAFQIIRSAILNGELSPGSKISENNTCQRYGIGRGPLREALRQLEGCKLVEIKPNAGAKVSYIKPAQIIEIYEIRESLEGLACKLAATNATTSDCLALRSIIAKQQLRMTQNNGDLTPLKKGDLDLHSSIVKVSGNAQLFQLLCHDLYQLLQLYRLQPNTSPSRPHIALTEHTQIVDAIEKKDSELADLLMRRHISNARHELLANLSP